MRKRALIALIAICSVALVLGSFAAVLWWKQPVAVEGATTWTCSMHPQVRLPKPGPCPICGMNLIPVESLSSQRAQIEKQTGLEIEPVEARRLVREIRAVGKLDYNERRVEYITARVAGRVDRLFVDFAGIDVKQQDHLVEIYSPDLLVAQRELLLASEASKRAGTQPRDDSAQANLQSVRQKLRLLGLLPEQIEEIENTRKAQTHLTIYSPLEGTVVEKNVRVGQYVNVGDLLYRIADLDPIWVFLDIYEYDIGWIEYGQSVQVVLEAFPGESFQGTVTFIDPFLNDQTRSVKVRVNLKNPERRLKPAMYASAVIRVPLMSDGTPEPTGMAGKFSCSMHPEIVRDEVGACPICEMKLEKIRGRKPSIVEAVHGAQEPPTLHGVLAVPVTAVLDTGRRQIVYRANKDGALELVEVTIGPRAVAEGGDRRTYFPIVRGLGVGDRVVVSGGFLLDSQRQIEGMPSLLYPQGQSAANLHSGHGGVSPPASVTPGHKH